MASPAVPAAQEPQPRAWRPGEPVVDETSITDVITMVGFGRADAADWAAIKDKLVSRGCTTVATLRDAWDPGELLSLIRHLKTKMQPRAYIAGISAAIGHDLLKDHVSKMKSERGEAAAGQGAGWHLHCTKVATAADFFAHRYKPDGRVFAHLPRKGASEYMEDKDEHLAVDLLWLDAHVHPEPSMGDYLPSGLPGQIGRICGELLPPFAASKKGAVRPAKQVITLRHQNARDAPTAYKRMVLSSEFQEYIQPKSRASVTWVDPSSVEQLTGNVRNTVMGELVGMYHKSQGEPMIITLPSEVAKAKGKEAAAAIAAASTAAAVAAAAGLAAAGSNASAAAAAVNAAAAGEDAAAAVAAASAVAVNGVRQVSSEWAGLLDGAQFGAEEHAMPWEMPALPKRGGGAKGDGAKTKKDCLLAKKSAAKAAGNAGLSTSSATSANARKRAKAAAVDSSDDEEEEEASDDDVDSSDVDSSEDDAGGRVPAPIKPPAKKLKQSTLPPSKIAMVEVAVDDALVTADAIEPPLTVQNAATRFVFVPAAQFDSEGIGGWVAKIISVARNKQQVTKLNFKDADGKTSAQYFKFDHVAATFRPLS